jgi:hypothetical protein
VRYSRSVLLVIIEALLIGLVPAAHSSPLDPTWITGYWDDHDFDHAVISIVNACATAAPSAPAPRRSGIFSLASGSRNQRSAPYRVDWPPPPAARR